MAAATSSASPSRREVKRTYTAGHFESHEKSRSERDASDIPFRCELSAAAARASSATAAARRSSWTSVALRASAIASHAVAHVILSTASEACVA